MWRVSGLGLRGFEFGLGVFLKEFSVRDLRGVLHRAFHRDQQGLELRVLEFVEYRCAMSHAQKKPVQTDGFFRPLGWGLSRATGSMQAYLRRPLDSVCVCVCL